MGATDATLLAIPYARLRQELRIAEEAMQRTEYDRWVHSAFIGWQAMSAMGAKVPAFNKYMKKLGLQEPKQKITRAELQRDKDKAWEALRLVEARFDGGNPQ